MRREATRPARRLGTATAVLAAVLLAATACGKAAVNDNPPKAGAGQGKPQPSAVSKGCPAPEAGEPNGKQWDTEPKLSIDAKATYTATLATNCGPITLTLDAAAAPHTVNSFVFLAGEKYFDHTKCHRLTTRGLYVLQCGDPTGTGMGGPGYEFADENLDGAVYPAGTVAMANAGPGTNGSQFFLVYRDAQLPPSYTPFGKITGGMDNLLAIAKQGVVGGGADGEPASGVVLDKVSAVKE